MTTSYSYFNLVEDQEPFFEESYPMAADPLLPPDPD